MCERENVCVCVCVRERERGGRTGSDVRYQDATQEARYSAFGTYKTFKAILWPWVERGGLTGSDVRYQDAGRQHCPRHLQRGGDLLSERRRGVKEIERHW